MRWAKAWGWAAVFVVAGCGSKPDAEERAGHASGPNTGQAGRGDKTLPVASASPGMVPTTIGLAPVPTAAASSSPARRGKLKPKVETASTTSLSGRLTTNEMETTLSDNITSFESCTTNHASVGLRALISSTGQVVHAAATRSTPDDPAMRDCVVGALERVRFPEGRGRPDANVTFNLTLDPY